MFVAKPKYVKYKQPENTSGGNNITRSKKRDIIISIAYAFGEISGEDIIINTKDKQTKDELVRTLTKIDWAHIDNETDTGFIIKAGVVRRPLIHIIKRISFGRAKIKTIVNALKFLQSDTLLKMLWLAHGSTVNGHRVIDMTDYLLKDIDEIVEWCKIINDVELSPINDIDLLMPNMIRDGGRKIYLLCKKKEV